ncbi:MAG: DUF2061 domain-containing protein [Endomicrobiia bacterium]|nr:DUF2061 domain-containing protein [Endomicrobiia bacterium]
MIEQRKRSVLKAVSHRAISTLYTTAISFVITGKISVAVSIGLVEIFTKPLLYYIHERAWNKVKFGRKKDIEYTI